MLYPADITRKEFLQVRKINDDETIDGILLFRPLPKYINEKRAEQMIQPEEGPPTESVCSDTARCLQERRTVLLRVRLKAVIEIVKGI